MAIQYDFLKPIDQKVRDQGYEFVSQDEYLQDGFKSTDGISYEGDGSPVSYANSMGGIMSQAPIPGPLKYIPPDGDGEGGKPPGPGPDLGAITADDYGYGPVGDMGMTEEEQAGVDGIKNAKMGKLGIAKTLASFAFMGPFAGFLTAYRQNKKAKEAAIESARAAQFGATNYGKGSTGTQSYSGDAVGAAGLGHGVNATTGGPVSNRTGRGRTDYFFGGRVNYKAGGRVGFKNGGLASIL